MLTIFYVSFFFVFFFSNHLQDGFAPLVSNYFPRIEKARKSMDQSISSIFKLYAGLQDTDVF